MSRHSVEHSWAVVYTPSGRTLWAVMRLDLGKSRTFPGPSLTLEATGLTSSDPVVYAFEVVIPTFASDVAGHLQTFQKI